MRRKPLGGTAPLYSMGALSFMEQSRRAAIEGEKMAQAAIAEYRAKGFKVTRIGDEIIVEGKDESNV